MGELHEIAGRLGGGAIDLSIGTPTDPPPPLVAEVLASSGTERGYPPSVGIPQVREAAARWLETRFGARIDAGSIAVCVGTKELVAGLPHLLSLRSPDRDTVLYPAVSYPSYAMGATLGGCRAVPVEMDEHWHLRLDSITEADAQRALCLWVNTPGNPAGGLDDLGAAARWGRERGVPVFSDECYAEFTWQGEPALPGMPPGRTILEHGPDGVVAVHSLSKRSNLAGLRMGFYGGDAELVEYLSQVRKHAGFMVPGPVQAVGCSVLADQTHVDVQRARYAERLEEVGGLLAERGVDVAPPGGGFYLWVRAPRGDAWAFARELAGDLGVVGSPGEFYGPAATEYLRLAMVQTEEQSVLLRQRAGM
ncbi:MAG: aminotransferase class I/II-fold pyridoxal phosphate-dependent enzyme [Microthrixaceae bacterium]